MQTLAYRAMDPCTYTIMPSVFQIASETEAFQGQPRLPNLFGASAPPPTHPFPNQERTNIITLQLLLQK